jgi:TonB family protein
MSALGAVQSVVSQAIAAFVLHTLWQAPLLAGAAAVAIRIGRPQARLAHVIWAATLLLCVLMPVGATVTARRAALEAERNAAATVSYVAADYAGPLSEMHRKSAWQRMLDKHFNVREGVRPFAFTLPVRVARAVAAVYLLIAFGLALRLMVGWRRSRRLVALSSPLLDGSGVARALLRQSDALGIGVPAVRMSDAVTGPALAGAFRPTLLLPACAEQMSEAEVEAVLAHELAHLRRHDPPVHLACSLLLVPVGFHPAVLWVAQRVRQTREMACDAEAGAQMGSAARYARALLQVAERTGAGGAIAGLGLFQSGLGLFDTGLGMTGGAMEERMQMMMNGTGSSSKAGRVMRWSACVLVGGVALVGAAMLQVQPALAQQQQAPVAVADSKAQVVEDQPQLLGGAHAQEQLRKARRDLDVAASKATTDEERSKIATARAVIGAAQEQLADASGGRQHVVVDLRDVQGLDPKLRVQLDALKDLKIDSPVLDPQVQVQLDALEVQLKDLKIDPQVRVQIRDLKIDPKMKAEIDRQMAEVEKHRAEYEAMTAKVQSPEFQAQMRAQLEEAKKQVAAAKIDQVQIARMMKDASQQQIEAMAMMRSGELQRQIDEASRLVARAELPALPALPDSQEVKRIKVASGVMAGNKISGNNPVYPQGAKDEHVSGPVVVHVLIDEAGNVEDAKVVDTPDQRLAEAALYAVMSWKYRPYLLNGKPMAVETTVTVNYSFGG